MIDRAHAIVAAVVCLCIPAASRLLGSGQLGWTMFSRTEAYRLVISGVGPGNAKRPIAPTQLAATARGPVSRYLIGADTWRTIPAGPILRRHLPEVGMLACRTGQYTTIEMELLMRANLDAPVESTKAHVDCPG